MNFSTVAALHPRFATRDLFNHSKHGFFDTRPVGLVHPAIADNFEIVSLSPKGEIAPIQTHANTLRPHHTRRGRIGAGGQQKKK